MTRDQRCMRPAGRVTRLRLGRTGAGDRGSSSVEFTLLFPIIVVILFAGPQIAMWYFAKQAAQAAANAGARAASVDGSASGAGITAGDEYLDSLGTGTITSYVVTESDTATTVTVRVRARVPNVIPLPGFTPTVDVTIVRDKERFTTVDAP